MRSHRSSLPSVAVVSSFAAAAYLALSALPAPAAQRTFVGTTGTDNPNCSIAAPCRTFTAAIAATSSAGEVVVLDSGGYGPVTIAKSVSLIAPPGIYAGISVLSGDGVTIAGSGIVVVLRGLDINGVGGNNGITINTAATVRVEGCFVSNMTASGILHNDGNLYVEDTTVRNNAGIGIWSSGTASHANLDRSRIEENADGVRAQNGAQAVVHDSVVIHNSSVGVFAYVTNTSLPTATAVTVSRSMLSYNNVGAQAHGDGTSLAYATVTDSTIVRNVVNGLLATQVGGGPSALYVRRNTLTDSASGSDVHVTSGAFGLFDDNWISGLDIDSGASATSLSNNTVSSYCCVGLNHESQM